MPGVQKPHCIASCATNASWTGCKSSPRARPSMVVMSRPAASTARMVQEQTGSPSSQTVQAEHAPRLQPILVPVNPSGPRRASTRVSARFDLQRPIRTVHPEHDVVRRRARRPLLEAFGRRRGRRDCASRPCADRDIDRSAENLATREFKPCHVAALPLAATPAAPSRSFFLGPSSCLSFIRPGHRCS